MDHTVPIAESVVYGLTYREELMGLMEKAT